MYDDYACSVIPNIPKSILLAAKLTLALGMRTLRLLDVLIIHRCSDLRDTRLLSTPLNSDVYS